MKNISVESLLAKAKTKYDLLKAQGTWGAASKEMENIIALCAHIQQIANTNLKLSKQLTKKQITSSTFVKPASNDSRDKGQEETKEGQDMDEGSTQGWREQNEDCGWQDLELVHSPHALDNAQNRKMQIGHGTSTATQQQ